MLSKKERKIFEVIFSLSAGRQTFLVTPHEILKQISYSINLTRREFEDILKTLVYDGYMELTPSDKKGEVIYCITLSTKGLGFDREILQYKRAIYFKVALTLATAIMGVIVTRLLSWAL